MPLPFRQQEPTTYSDVPLKWDVPFNQWLGVKLGQNFDFTLGSFVSKNTEEVIWDNGDLLKPELANSVFGVPGELEFKEPISIQKARLFRERKDAELNYRAYAQMANHSALSVKGAAGFAAGILGSIAHPFDLGLGFVISPFKGPQTAYTGFRGAINRGTGFLTRATQYPTFKQAVVEGIYSNAIFEIPIAFQARKEQADYTLSDSLINIGAGGLFAGGIHMGLRGLERIATGRSKVDARIQSTAERIRQVQEEFKLLTKETQQAASDLAVRQELSDVDADISRVVALDEKVIEAQVRFDEAAALARAEKAVGLEAKDIEAAAASELGRPRLEGLEAVNNARHAKFSVPEGATAVRVTTADGKMAVQMVDTFRGQNPFVGAEIAKIEAGAIGKGGKFTPIEGSVSVVEAKAPKGKSPSDPVTFQQKVEALTQQRIKEYVESMRQAHEATKPERVEALRQQEMERIKQEHAKRIPADKQQTLMRPPDVDPKEIAEHNADTAAIIRDLEKEMNEQEAQVFAKDIEKMKSSTPENIDKAVDEGLECIISETIRLNG